MNIKSKNPVLNKKLFNNYGYSATGEGTMTINGTINKIGLLFLLTLGSAAYTWNKAIMSGVESITPFIAVGAIGGFVTAIITTFSKTKAHIFAPIYAVLEGLFLGGISVMLSGLYEGIVMRAVLLTLAVLFAMLFAYRSGLIKVTQKFRAGVVAATLGIAVAYFFSFILGLFGMNMSFMYGGGTMGLVISLVIVGVAALNLVLDFDFIDQGSAAGLPKHFEWYAAFGLMVTLIWLYIEILRLLAIFANRN